MKLLRTYLSTDLLKLRLGRRLSISFSTVDIRGAPLKLAMPDEDGVNSVSSPKHVSHLSVSFATDLVNVTRTHVDVGREANQSFTSILLTLQFRWLLLVEVWTHCKWLLENSGSLQDGSYLGGPPKVASFFIVIVWFGSVHKLRQWSGGGRGFAFSWR